MYRIGQEEIDAVARVINSKQLFKVNSGDLQESYNFEKEFCEKLNTKHTILMTSGQGALVSALIGMGVGPGDEVIVPAYTYIATGMAVVAVGAMPVIAEIDDSLMLDPNDFEKKITPRTKAVIPVHLMGYPCDMDKICAIAKKHNIMVLEDACQADGGSYKGKRLGTIGDAGAFSFNYFKVITAGEGGALVTDNQLIYERALIYHDSSAVAFFGNQMEDFETVPFCGTELRTNEITAAILREQLKKLDTILSDLRKNKKKLMDKLAPHFEFVRSNDIDGDCGTTITLKFTSSDEAEKFVENFGNNPPYPTIPYNTGKHVYSRWTPILEKRGALNPHMNPFNMAQNKAPEYSEDMCKKSIEILKRHVHIAINPDWTDEEIDELTKKTINARN